MASIQEEVTSQVWNLVLKFLGTGTEFVYQIAHEGNVLLTQGGNLSKELMLALINKQKEKGEPTDVTSKMLARTEKGETINTMAVAEEDALELSKFFGKKNILFNVIENPTDDSKLFMYMSDDAQKVQDILSLWQAERGLVSEINTTLFLDNYASDNIGTLSGLDRADLEIFRNFAKKNNLVFASTQTDEKDKYLIVYDPKDAALVKKTMDSVVWAISGTDGARFKQQMVVYLKNRQKINRSLLEGEKEFYIVNGKAPNQYAFLTANDLTYYKNSKEILSVDKSSNDFMDRSLRVINSMARPVILSRDEFELFDEKGDRDIEAVNKVVSDLSAGVPELDILLEEQEKLNAKLERLQSKLALDDEGTAGFWIYDDSIGFEGGAGYEEIEDVDDRVKEDLASAKQNASRFKFYEIKEADNRSIDYLIAEAEKHHKEDNSTKKSREMEI